MNIDAIVIPCSKNKKTTPAEAEYLYVGPYYKACLDYAKKHTKKKNIYILSAKYGFIKLNDIIAPYNTKITKKIKQERRCFYINTAKQHNLTDKRILVLDGRLYVDVVRTVTRKILTAPFYGQPLGIQLREMKNVNSQANKILCRPPTKGP